MVCPMKNSPNKRVQTPTEYPYQPLYRPWSWIFSSLFNIFLFAVLIGILYVYYKTKKSGKRKRIVTYRTIQVSQEESGPKKKTALVTGGNQVIGGEVVRALIQDGEYEVHSLDLLLPEDDERIEGVSTYIQADITNVDDLRIAFKNTDAVFHCWSLTPTSIRHSDDDYYQVNIVGTENVIKACLDCGVKRLLYTSSASVNLSKDPQESSCDADESSPIPDKPLDIYVATLGKADQLVLEADGKDDLKTCVLRPSIFVEGLLAGVEERLYYPTGLEYEVSLVSIESAIKAHLNAEKKLANDTKSLTVAGKAFIISEHNVKVLNFAEFIAKQKNTSVTFVPLPLVKFLAWINVVVYKWTGLVAVSESLTSISVQYKSHTYVSSLAQQELGWKPGVSWEDQVKVLLKKRGNDEESKKNN